MLADRRNQESLCLHRSSREAHLARGRTSAWLWGRLRSGQTGASWIRSLLAVARQDTSSVALIAPIGVCRLRSAIQTPRLWFLREKTIRELRRLPPPQVALLAFAYENHDRLRLASFAHAKRYWTVSRSYRPSLRCQFSYSYVATAVMWRRLQRHGYMRFPKPSPSHNGG